MLVYIIMTILAVIFSALANNYKIKYKEGLNTQKKTKIDSGTILWYLSEMTLIIVAAIRYDVGQDYMYTYVPYFNGLLLGNINKNIEIGFRLLNEFIQFFSKDYIWIFIVCSVIFFHYIYKAIKEQSPMKTLSIFLLVGTTYYFVFLNTMRQMLAVAIFVYAIKFIKERKLLKYLIYMFVASTIHTSALILIPIYFLYGIKIKPMKAMIILLIAIAIKPVVTNVILKILEFTKYSYYIDSRFDTNETGFVVLAMNICVLVFALIYARTSQKSNIDSTADNMKIEEDKKYFFFCFLQLLSTLLAWYNDAIPLLNRIRWALGLPIIILIPLIIKREKNQNLRLLYTFVIVVLYTVYALYTVGINNANSVLPYTTIFQRGG